MLVLFPVLIYTRMKYCFVVKQVAIGLPGFEGFVLGFFFAIIILKFRLNTCKLEKCLPLI